MTDKQKATENQPIVWSLGHSNRSFNEFLNLLVEADIQTVVDCRSKPRSRWPQYNQSRLHQLLDEAGIGYEFYGNRLGGLGGNIDQDGAISELSERAKSGERIAIMCSEARPADCHRGTVLAPLFEANDIHVRHLFYGATV